MLNQDNLGKHEIAELLADLDEAAAFLRSLAIIGGPVLGLPQFPEDTQAFRRWAQSINTISRMVETTK